MVPWSVSKRLRWQSVAPKFHNVLVRIHIFKAEKASADNLVLPVCRPMHAADSPIAIRVCKREILLLTSETHVIPAN